MGEAPQSSFASLGEAPQSHFGCHGVVRFPEEQRLFRIEDVNYMALPVSDSVNLEWDVSKISITLVTVVSNIPQDTLTWTWLQGLVNEWQGLDDVFRTEFLEGVIWATHGNREIGSGAIAENMQSSWGTKWSKSVSSGDLDFDLNPGPHVIWKGKLCKVFRLYDDPQNAFVLATKPQTNPGPYQKLRVSGESYSLSVAVSSRIESRSAKKGPLAGLRFAVKDIFAIEGIRNTAGCRAWYDLSLPSHETAPAIQKLVDAGADLVGTLKMGSLITKEEPTESVDYHAPFNPRGDGYQSAWSSSGGSGAAVAAYDWLDFTLGTDTTGSSRRPAMANGCFQIRVSHDAITLSGIVPSWTEFDAPAIFAREIAHLESGVGEWASAKPQAYSSPISILYLKDFLPVAQESQMELIEAFIVDLESTFDTNREELSIAELWRERPPEDVDSIDIREYLKDVGVNSFCYGVYHELDQFREQYRARYSKDPYINPVMRWRWATVETVTKEQHDDAVHRLRIYKDWFLREVMQDEKRNSLVILPITAQAVDYRDIPPEPPSAPNAFDGIWLAPTLGAPEISVPIGEIEYQSCISKRKEYLPIVVSLLGLPGSDMELIDAAHRTLKKAGRPSSVATGARMIVDRQTMGITTESP